MPDFPARDSFRAMVLTRSYDDAGEFRSLLASHGMTVEIFTDAGAALAACRSASPHLAVVEADLGSMTGYSFVRDLLKIAWTVSSIVVSEEDDAVIHDKAEGLGILGHVRSFGDTAALEGLLVQFKELNAVFSKETGG